MEGRPAASLASSTPSSAGSEGTKRLAMYLSTSVHFFRGRKEHQHQQVFFNVIKAVLGPGFHKNNRSCHDIRVLRANHHPRPSFHHVIHLIFFMRRLSVLRALWQKIDSGAHCGNSKKLKVGATARPLLAYQLFKMMEMVVHVSPDVHDTCVHDKSRSR